MKLMQSVIQTKVGISVCGLKKVAGSQIKFGMTAVVFGMTVVVLGMTAVVFGMTVVVFGDAIIIGPVMQMKQPARLAIPKWGSDV